MYLQTSFPEKFNERFKKVSGLSLDRAMPMAAQKTERFTKRFAAGGLRPKALFSKTFPFLVSLRDLFTALSAPRDARAWSGHLFLETLGLSIGAGTVFGASTLPFYDQPGTHLEGLGFGAAIGAIAGLGIAVYQWIAGRSSEDLFTEGDRVQHEAAFSFFRNDFTKRQRSRVSPAASQTDLTMSSSRPALVLAPWVSVTW